ncbi:MAG: hypothetical protein R8G66_22200 [Cytophagales bacterium]|nr:hypothetical protein [Cytophagales bacterium]
MITELRPGTIDLESIEMTGVTPIADQRFSQALQLEANSELKLLELAHLQATCSVWIKRQSTNSQLNLSVAGGWSISAEGELLLNETSTGQVMPQDQWYYLCLTFKNGEVTLHINGEFCAAMELDAVELTGELTFSSASGHILLANPMFTELALSESAIQSNYISDLPTISQSFTQAQPINFNLVNQSDGPFDGYPDDKLFIVDAIGKDTVPMQLVVQNVDTEPIELEASNQVTAGKGNHHFELRFRNGVFAQIKDTLQFEEHADWIISEPLQDPLDHTWSVFFLAKSAITWEAGESWIFPFQYRSADGALGERGTHVSLSYRQMNLKSGGILTGDRTRQVDILNLSSNNQYISQMSEQVSLTDQKIDNMESRTAIELKKLKENLSKGKQIDGMEQAESLGDILSLVNKRLTLLDNEVDDRSSTTNKRLEDLEAGAPFSVAVRAPQDLVRGKSSNTFTIYVKNRTDKMIRIQEQGQLIISIPYGNKVDDLSGSARGCGTSNPDFGPSETGKFQVFKWNMGNIGPGVSRAYTFNGVSINNLTGTVNIPVVVTGMEGYQTQQTFVSVHKVSHDTPPVGTVIDWFRPTKNTAIPTGWRIANGDYISSKDQNADASMRGKRLPNLNGRFVRGVTSSSASGAVYGGRDSHNHSHSLYNGFAGAHNHKWLDMSGRTIRSFRSSGGSGYGFHWNNGHDTSGSGYYSMTWGSGGWEDRYTDNEGNHRHPIYGAIKSSSHVPSYVGLLKLIRVI